MQPRLQHGRHQDRHPRTDISLPEAKLRDLGAAQEQHMCKQIGKLRRPILANFGHFWGAKTLISVKLGTLTLPILADMTAHKHSILVKLEAVGGPILVHFGPPSQPLWAPGRPIFANFGHFWGVKAPDFDQT